jgi:hypothetical protein
MYVGPLIEEKSIGWPNGKLDDFWANFRRTGSSSVFHVLFRTGPPAGSYTAIKKSTTIWIQLRTYLALCWLLKN